MTDTRIVFHGAARTVTGSSHLVETGGRRLLLDCGLFQGRRDEARRRNREFPFDPASIDAVVLSHAHIDHCGNLPNLVKQGFAGPIVCTSATRDLCEIMLADSARIQEEDAEYLNRKRERGDPEIRPLYTVADAEAAIARMRPIGYHVEHALPGGAALRFTDAGHILGSAMVSLTFADGKRLTFTGDVGRRLLPILRDPEPIPECDALICESTYGNRDQSPVADAVAELGRAVRETVLAGGKVLIPAFSVGRTQSVLYHLRELSDRRIVPDVPIFVDSPLAGEATEIYRRHPECFDSETKAMIELDRDAVGAKRVRYTRGVQDSKAINDLGGPCIVIAASGMCEAGRILHHLIHHIGDPKTTVLMIGHQAGNTLGRKLVEGMPRVPILGKLYDNRARTVVLDGFSSHAGRSDLLAAITPLKVRTKSIRLVHGEPESSESLADALRAIGFTDTAVPAPGDVLEV